jgi:hypothetical protein
MFAILAVGLDVLAGYLHLVSHYTFNRRDDMKTILLTIALFSLTALAQQPSVSGQSSGDCSPNILANSGGVQFVCKTAIDEETSKKIVSLLNQILKKENRATSTDEINRKLDEILDFIKHEQRHLTETQKTTLISLLKGVGPQSFYFLAAHDAEATHFSNELANVLTSPELGWTILELPPGGVWGQVSHEGEGLFILVSDLNKPPKGTVELQKALIQIGFNAPFSKYPLMYPGKFAIYVGVNP